MAAAKAELKGVLSLQTTLFEAGLKKAGGAAVGFASKIGGALRSAATGPLAIVGAALAGAFAAKNFIGGIQAAIVTGGAMKTLSEQTGISVGAMKTLGYAFSEAEVDSGLVAGSVGRMQATLFAAAKGGKEAQGAIGLLHFRAEQLIRLAPEEQFRAIGTAIDNLEDPTMKAGAAMAIFGREGRELLPVFSNLRNLDFDNLRTSAEVLEKNAAAFRQIAVGFSRVFGSIKGLYLGIASELVAPLQDVLHLLPKIDFVAWGQKIGRALSGAYYAVKGFVTNFGTSMAALGGVGLDIAHIMELAFVGSFKRIGVALSGAFDSAFASIAKSFSGLLEVFKGSSILDGILGMSVESMLGRLKGVSAPVSPDSVLNPGKGGGGGGMDDFKRASELLSGLGPKFSALAAALFKAGGGDSGDAIKITKKNAAWRFKGFPDSALGAQNRNPFGSNSSLQGATMAGTLGQLSGPFLPGQHATTLGLLGSSLDRGAYGKVSRGDHLIGPHASAGGYNQIRRGDHQRRQNEEREARKNAEGAQVGKGSDPILTFLQNTFGDQAN